MINRITLLSYYTFSLHTNLLTNSAIHQQHHTDLDHARNATLAGIPSFQLDRLQAVVNAAARLVFQSSRHDHVTPLLHRLHWLRAPERTAYNSPCWCTSASMDWRRPAWLTLYSLSLDFLVDNACVHHRPRHSTIGDRAFPVAAARTWNSLPSEVSSLKCLPTFKTKLKTHLFSASFP